jgi:DNA-binding XRE family transcriptional regulator
MTRERDYLPKGSQHHNAKINEEDAVHILELIEMRKELMREASQLTLEAIAEKFGVSKQTVADISIGKTWKHIRSAK